MRPTVFLFVAVAIFAALPEPTSAQELTPAPLEVRVADAPVPIRALGRWHLVYELHVSHLDSRPGRLLRLDVLGPGDVLLACWGEVDLSRRVVRMGRPPGPDDDPLLLLPGSRSIIYLWIAMRPGTSPPSELRHRLSVSDVNVVDEAPFELETDPVGVADAETPLGEAPVTTGRWVALRGPSNDSGHRRSVVVLDGAARVPQRFAVDWARLGDDGRLFRGDGARNEDWYGYGQLVLASRAGTVVRVVDGLAEHPPGPAAVAAWRQTTEHTVDNVAGNVVIVEESEGRYAVYAHLRPGSIGAEPGDQVVTGQALAEIGNSGHSLAPHLHHHVGDRAATLAAEGRPFRLRRVRLVGKLDDPRALIDGGAWAPDPRRPARWVKGETPLENMVVEVPGGAD